MDWIQLLELQQKYQRKQLTILKKWKKFTLYDHNSAVFLNQENQSFTCVFNCKKINTHHSIIGKIQGCLKTHQITITNTLTDHEVLLAGKWQYQKIQLTRFAFRYNQRSNNNILIKVNPISGQVAVCMSFVISPNIINDQQQFKQIITDFCQILGEQSQKVFNTMMQIIYQRQSNQPYLKSGIKVNPNFPRYMKVQKLLDKVKSLIATSSHYKIRVDTSSAHKNRSYFKKLYLTNEKKYIKDEQIQKLALLYELKYNKVYEQNARKMLKQKAKQYIKDYTELQQKNQVQFAKHLNENQKYQQRSYVNQSITQIQDAILNEIQQPNQMKKIIKIATKLQYPVLIDTFQDEENKHTLEILKKLEFNHPNIVKYYIDQKSYPNTRITEGFNSISLEEFLNKNKKTISLPTKFDIMAQICHALQFMHKKFVGCFLRTNDILIDQNFRVKVRNLSYAYAVNQKTGWKDTKSQNSQNNQSNKLDVQYQKNPIEFPFINITSGTQFDKSDKRCLQNEKNDVYSLGIVLYRIMMEKYPFFIESLEHQIAKMNLEQYNRTWKQIWTVQTQYFLCQGGQIAKLVAHLLLKCFNAVDIGSRPYVEWMTVILSQIKTSLNGLY